MNSFFVQRPRFAFVLSVFLVVMGVLFLPHLHTCLLPEIKQPKIRIVASYPAASPKILEETVIKPIEKQLNGLNNMKKITSFSSNDGFAIVKATFTSDTNIDRELINIRNLIEKIKPSLPTVIQSRGIYIDSMVDTQLIVISLYSPDNTLQPFDLDDYAHRILVKPLLRVNGVASVNVSHQIVVNISLNMEKLKNLDIPVHQISQAIQEQNQSVALGSIGSTPNSESQNFHFTLETNGLLTSIEQIRKTIIKTSEKKAIIYLEDVADVAIGAENPYASQSTLNGKPSTLVNIYQQPDANTLQTAEAVRKQFHLLSQYLPENIKASIIIDTSHFITIAIKEVIKTLIEAVILVILIVFLSLQSWRATLAPALAIPISLIGTLIFLFLFDYSINIISLFALILSIGIVVDDAIIVVENVERHLHRHPTVQQAIIAAMQEITAPIIITTCVLLSVFVTAAFIPGIQGKIFQQFSVVLSISVIISSFVALTLSPALCTILFTKKDIRSSPSKKSVLNLLRNGYTFFISKTFKFRYFIAASILILSAISFFILKELSSGFIPNEDQGFLRAYIKLPPIMPPAQIDTINHQISHAVRQQHGIKNILLLPYNEDGENSIYGFIELLPWSERKKENLNIDALIKSLEKKLSSINNTKIFIYNPSLIHTQDMGSLRLHIQSTGHHTLDELATVANGFADTAEESLPEIDMLFSNFDNDTAAFKLLIDKKKVKAMNVSLNDINDALSALRPHYISTFHQHNNMYDIQMQIADKFKTTPSNLNDIYVKSRDGNMIALASFMQLKKTSIASWIPRVNLYRTASLSGRIDENYSLNQAVDALEKLCEHLPEGYRYQWSNAILEKIKSKEMLPWLILLALTFIYLFLVSLYESWFLPFAILIVTPLGLLGASIVLYCKQMENNIYTQLGFLLLIGMTAKSTILMTEFSIQARGRGESIFNAAYTAAKLRFRPVLITSLSFILGVSPFLFDSGPGSNSRFYLGVTIISGMITATFLGLLSSPSIYMIIQSIREKIKGPNAAKIAKNARYLNGQH